MNWMPIIENMGVKISDYVEKHSLRSLIIGMSGGADSLLTAALLDYHYALIPSTVVIGRSLTIESNTEEEQERARTAAKAFCLLFEEKDLTERYHSVVNDMAKLDPSILEDNDSARIRRGNIKARLRMIELYDVASKNQGMVIGTGNWTEYFLGFTTLHGDVGDYCLIGTLWKTEVYELLSFFREMYSDRTDEHSKLMVKALQQGLDADPTDGLGISKTDLDQILPGWREKYANNRDAYRAVDDMIKTWLCEDEDAFSWDECFRFEGRPETFDELLKHKVALKTNPVILRLLATEYKRKVPIFIRRHDLGFNIVEGDKSGIQAES